MTLNSVQDAHGRECLVVEVDLDRVPAVQVRADVRRVGRCAGIEVSDAVQVSDELVSNACRRACSPRTCRLLVNEHGRFRIEVHDSSPGADPPARPYGWARTAAGHAAGDPMGNRLVRRRENRVGRARPACRYPTHR